MRGRLSTVLTAAIVASVILQPTATASAPALPTGETPAQAANPSSEDEAIDYHGWSSAQDFASGERDGVRPGADGMRISEPAGSENGYEYGTWTSPVHEPGFDASELISSWNAHTPEGTWLKVQAQARTAGGDDTSWYTLGKWAYGDGDIERTSVTGQSDEHAAVYTDTLSAADGVALRAYRLRVTLYRAEGSDASPVVTQVGAMTSDVPDRFEPELTEPGEAAGIELDVPTYAQNVHRGNYPEYGGGGQAWCSPTSTTMVAEYWGAKPTEEQLSWLPADYPDKSVAHAARHTYDYAYEGTGNWPFNTAYASQYGLKGHITRLHSLAELESYIARGIPVITSQSFLEKELDGAGYGTAGHLMVVVGFTADGDVIANDPASESNDQVRRVYDREQFETIWQRTKRYDAEGEVASGSGGVAYIIEG
ncbi:MULTISPECIES: peptidase C39 family protein [Prauserella salsuginis group]|uniref:Peptidase C39-like domain-containing protein n=2 Tax=Prauserella salsuginis group TaxID=2893672 RepID=A0A839XNN0_9PSEU|nr:MULTISPECIES: peptidase C39 family protein [Prauserella salsuginis group]MBB3663519.1 hypothetical protein [Prauserella sediminis]MCR3720662.1 Peptidase_C39 like family protein [Prauserella flava]MCR3735257.1 Peptidase_C39 like family protein [Prauserella salsuginis]